MWPATGVICTQNRRRSRSPTTSCGALRRVVDLLVDVLGDGIGQPGERLELVERRVLHRPDPTELLHQPLAPRGTEAGHALEHRLLRHALAPQVAVVVD